MRGDPSTAVCSLISTLPPQNMRDLAHWPLMTKNMLRQHLDDLVADDVDVLRELARHRLSDARTSGATGEQMRVLVDMQLDRAPPDYESVWGASFGTDTPRTAILTNAACVHDICGLRNSSMEARMQFPGTLVCRTIPNLFSVDDAVIEQIVDELEFDVIPEPGVDLDLAGLPGNARIVDRLWAAPSMKIPLVRC